MLLNCRGNSALVFFACSNMSCQALTYSNTDEASGRASDSWSQHCSISAHMFVSRAPGPKSCLGRLGACFLKIAPHTPASVRYSAYGTAPVMTSCVLSALEASVMSQAYQHCLVEMGSKDICGEIHDDSPFQAHICRFVYSWGPGLRSGSPRLPVETTREPA